MNLSRPTLRGESQDHLLRNIKNAKNYLTAHHGEHIPRLAKAEGLIGQGHALPIAKNAWTHTQPNLGHVPPLHRAWTLEETLVQLQDVLHHGRTVADP